MVNLIYGQLGIKQKRHLLYEAEYYQNACRPWSFCCRLQYIFQKCQIPFSTLYIKVHKHYQQLPENAFTEMT